MTPVDFEKPLWLPADNVTSRSYEDAVSHLQAFLTVNVRGIRDIEDLDLVLSPIYGAFQTVLVGVGAVRDVKVERLNSNGIQEKLTVSAYSIEGKIQREGLIERLKKAQNRGYKTFSMTSDGERVYFTSYNRNGDFNYILRIPTHRRIADLTLQDFNNRIFYAYALDRNRLYYPADEPMNMLTQRMYAKVLQKAIKDLLRVVPNNGSEVPQIFYS